MQKMSQKEKCLKVFNFCRMIVTGYKRPLVDSDLWRLKQSDHSAVVTKRFMKNWNAELVKAGSA